MDFNSNPSFPTGNNSTVQIYGDDTMWVEGTYGQIMEELKKCMTKRALLHKANIYDYFVWLLIIPLTFRNLYRLDLKIHNYLSQISPAFMVFFYLFMFLLILIIFRLLFSYLKWLFPYMEFETSGKRGFRWYRRYMSIIFSGVVITLIIDLIIGISQIIS